MLVYPPNEHKTFSSSIFFIGSAYEEVFINSKKILLYPNFNFLHFEDLSLGKNYFTVVIDGKENELLLHYDPNIKNEQAEILEIFLENDIESLFLNQNESKRKVKRICIDPGHGGMFLGCRSPKGIKEKDLNLEVALLLDLRLKEAGFNSCLTRKSDIEISLAERVNFSREFLADLFISIHHNAVPDHKNPMNETGISAHFYSDKSKNFSARLIKYLSKQLFMNLNGLFKQNLYVLRENPSPLSVLLELGFLIHPFESEIIIQKEYQEKFVRSFVDFLKNE